MDKTFLQVALLCCVGLTNGQQYCNLASCKAEKHTMCAYPSPDPSSACGELGAVGLTQDEKNALLKAHNDYRAYVASGQETRGSNGGQPAATNLGPLSWNDEIAEIAQRWANQCDFSHDKCRNTANGWVGQNIAALMWSDSWHDDSINNMVDMWYNEVDKFNKDLISSYQFSKETGHYSQLVWADTTSVGCGAIRYHQPGGWYTTHLVCDYAPGGNYIGAPIYKTS